ncbi:MAG TPA: 3-phosphoshikimate 1-carboxyvinyltransferase [Lachnospiraceae bacterium]|uniref:3-phosphoshikimate 1-carboxyvinyltransferase n=1 Tax=Anaerosporobacter sp. TaxID=1872529 RepID=UPI000ECAB6EF|nr:3-phosphoshikimate 1-carboxyvinyltransferase [Anaerosporobacter sp.]HAB60935.1 3-phosphoshikimate 1-carboxyvinyltransferase [Lachnospiraceae bacterium]
MNINNTNNKIYRCRKQNKPISGIVKVPGSKSMTNRALLLATLSKKDSKLSGVLFSDDSRHFLMCLEQLGFRLQIDELNKTVTMQGTGGNIPNKTGSINVGSAGTAARFLTALLALSDGEYIIDCSEQMKKRPMKPLFDALTEMGASFMFLEEEGFLPARVIGNGGTCTDVTMDISKSTQFLSALLMVAPLTKNGLRIKITSEKKDGAYIRITRKMMEQFGAKVDFDGEVYEVLGDQEVVVGDYYIEPDVSAACYFYAIAALLGGSITVKNVLNSSMQGDMKFLGALKQLGCKVEETEVGITVSGPNGGVYEGIDIDMNDFSDQSLTMAALAAYATTPTVIRNVGHTRLQECNRMAAIVNELNRVGVNCIEEGDDLRITPGEIKPAIIETYEDHRVAMAFSLLGLKSEGIIINNPDCCKKTFEEYFEVLDELLDKNK